MMINEYLELYVYFRSGETYVGALYTTLEIDPSYRSMPIKCMAEIGPYCQEGSISRVDRAKNRERGLFRE